MKKIQLMSMAAYSASAWNAYTKPAIEMYSFEFQLKLGN
jgi:hypothetical protein